MKMVKATVEMVPGRYAAMQAQVKVAPADMRRGVARKMSLPELMVRERQVAAAVHRIAAEVYDLMAQLGTDGFAVCIDAHSGWLWLEGQRGDEKEARSGADILRHAVDAAGFAS